MPLADHFAGLRYGKGAVDALTEWMRGATVEQESRFASLRTAVGINVPVTSWDTDTVKTGATAVQLRAAWNAWVEGLAQNEHRWPSDDEIADWLAAWSPS